MKKIIILFVVLIFLTVGCIASKQQGGGIYGKVTLITGNCMPPIEEGKGCREETVAREIYISQATSMPVSEVNVLKTISSQTDGSYSVELAPGTYSIFVEDEGEKYCNSFGSQGEACQVTVSDQMIEYNIRIDHATW